METVLKRQTSALDQSRGPQKSAPSNTVHDSISPNSIAAAGNQAMQRLLELGVIQAKLSVSSPTDPDEQEADRVAERVMSAADGAPAHGQCDVCASGSPCSTCAADERIQAKHQPGNDAQTSTTPNVEALRGGGQPLASSLRSFFEPRFGKDFSDVRVHTDGPAAESARAIRARAYTYGSNIVFGARAHEPESSAGQKLLAHELTHVVQQTGRVQRFPDQCEPAPAPPSCLPTPNACFIEPQPPPDAPRSVHTEVQVQSPATNIAHPLSETVVLDEPVLCSTPIVLYAIPIALTSLGPGGESQTTCVAPGSPVSSMQSDRDEQTTASAFPFSAPAFPGVPDTGRAVSVEGQPIVAEVVTPAYVLVSQYHHLAVGAGATTVLETPQGVRLIDAGVGTDGGAEIANAILERVASIVGERPITEVMITHLHEDHTELLPRLAERFPIGRLRVNALQFSDPRFRQLLLDIATSQARGVQDRAGREFDSRRTAWERAEGSAIADDTLRNRAFESARDAHIRDALTRLRDNPTTVELLIPDGSRLRAVSAPLGTLPTLTGTTTDPISEGLRRSGVAGDISDTAFTDPALGRQVAAQRARQAADPAARVGDTAIDTGSTNYIIDLPGGNRLIAVPDIRTDDLRRRVAADTRRRANLEAELARLGSPARFQAWNMTHHMQSGWMAGGAPHLAGPGELEGFIRLMENIREIQAAQRAPGAAPPANVLVVSAQHDVARSLVNPGMVWFLRSLGFDVFLASVQRDVRLIEATTAGGARISGLSGLPFEAARPSAPLLMQSDAAIRFLEQKIVVEEARRPTTSVNRAARRANLARLRAARDAVTTARQELIRVASQELWRGAHDTTRPAVAPDPAAGTPPAIAAAEQALRTSMQAPDLSDFTAPQATEAPVISDTALVLLRRQGDAALDTEGRQILEINQRVDTLRARLQSGERNAELLGQLTTELQNLRQLIQERLANAPEASRPVLQEELLHTQRELESLVRSREGEILFTREPLTGRLIENRVVRTGPTPADRMRQRLDMPGRLLGGLMVYQTVREQEHLAQQVQAGEATIGQGLVGTARSFAGVTIGVRMMTGIHVHPAEFVLMSVLEVTQASLGRYESPEEQAVAISQAAIQEGVSLALMWIGQVMMRSPNPYVVAAGFGIMFLTRPIMWALEEAGVFAAVERWSAFLPSEVTAANQRLRDLMTEYRAIVGALELASRSDAQLQALGVFDPQGMRSRSSHDVTTYRNRARNKEQDLLTAFAQGYQRAQSDYAGLHELDTLRNSFLDLRRQVYAGVGATDDVARRRTLDFFAERDRTLSMDQFTAQQVNDMPQWTELSERLGEFQTLLWANTINWEDVRSKEQEIEQMLRNARYRIDPASFGMRTEPLIHHGTPAYSAYVPILRAYEDRMTRLQTSLSQLAAPGSPGIIPASGEMTYENVEAMLASYLNLLEHAPARPFTAARLYQHSMTAGPDYRSYVDDHADYSSYLERLHAAEMALRAVAPRVARSRTGPPTESESTLQARIRSAINRRSVELGLVYLDEVAALTGSVREREIDRLAPMLGQAATVRPLSASEQVALQHGELEDYARQITTVTNRLQQVQGLRIPDSPNDPLEGIYRVEGNLSAVFLLITELPTEHVTRAENVLVGITGPADEEVTAHGHEPAVRIVPVNAAAERRLGGPRTIWRSRLRPVLLRELLPETETTH